MSRLTPRNDTGIHEGGQTEVHQDKKGDDALDNGHEPQMSLHHVPLRTPTKKSTAHPINKHPSGQPESKPETHGK